LNEYTAIEFSGTFFFSFLLQLNKINKIKKKSFPLTLRVFSTVTQPFFFIPLVQLKFVPALAAASFGLKYTPIRIFQHGPNYAVKKKVSLTRNKL
jgi:hypothetical protein